MSMMRRLMGLSVLLILMLGTPEVAAVIPSAQLEFSLAGNPRQFASMFGAPSRDAGWGRLLPDAPHAEWMRVFVAKTQVRDGCDAYSLPALARSKVRRELNLEKAREEDATGTIAVVERGNCSFLRKAQQAQQAGARMLIVRGTKEAIFDAIQTENASNMSSLVPSNRPPFEYDCKQGEAYVAEPDVPMWKTDHDACRFNPQCASQRCVLTGVVDASQGGHQVCCLWDTFVLMGANRTEAANLSIPVVYVTLAEGEKLERAASEFPELLLRASQRPVSVLDLSSVLLWAIGVATAIGGAYYSAVKEREDANAWSDSNKSRKSSYGDVDQDDGQDTMEISARHAVMFILLSGIFLVVFYYLKFARVVPFLFAVAAVGAVAQVVLVPALVMLIPATRVTLIDMFSLQQRYTVADVLGTILSATLAIVWYTHRRECWYLQDAFGVVLCFLFLRAIQLPNLKVATVLLWLAFVYDVFFVFLSPLVFGSSVMEDVATGGPAAFTHSDYPGVDYCERYPKFPACEDPEPMPMLLVLPRILDWVGGASMLGLGDIILPGLLLSLALRAEYWPGLHGHGYFSVASIAYAVGLGMANLAVMITQVGQPALMYVVPLCLGATVVTAKRNGDLPLLWKGLEDIDDEVVNDEARQRWNQTATHGHHEVTGSDDSAVSDGDTPHDQAPLLGTMSPSTSHMV